MSESYLEKSPAPLRHMGWILAALLVFYAVVAAGTIRSIYPIDDEAYFASPAFNLAQKGFFGTTVLDDKGPRWPGLSQATYWIQPLHGLLLAAWVRLFGASLWSQRSLSAVFGALDLCAWFWIVRALSRRNSAAVAAVALLVTEHCVLGAASLGRMDMMAAALGHCALAAYLVLRRRSLERALLAGFSLVALAGLTHPLGGILSLFNLVVTAVYFDRTALRWKHAVLVAAPFLTAGLVWSIYIAQHPAWFLTQFTGNARDTDSQGVARLSGFRSPLEALYRFAHNVIVYEYSDSGHLFTKAALVKLFVPAFYVFCLIVALSIKPLRRSSGVMLLLVLFATDYSVTAIMEARLKVQYFFHVLILLPPLIALLREYWRKPAFTAACVLLALVQCIRIGHSIWHDAYRAEFAPSVSVLQQPPYRGTDLWATAEYAYAAGFDHVVEDGDYGLFSHRRPRFIVIPASIFEETLNSSDYKKHILTGEYAVRYRDPRIIILERNPV